MKISHASRPSRIIKTEAGRQGGFVMLKFALLLVPLLMMVGFSVDIGYWYNRTASIQKAADAAALAGVVWLPDTASATTQARTVAQRNGFEHGVDGVTVEVESVIGQTRRLRVTISDPSVGSFFYEGLTGRRIPIGRAATAEYVLPVPLGSPQNVFGTDPTLPASQRANLWGNIHGPKTNSISGDAFAPSCRGSENCATQTNDSYRPAGYLYAIDVPAGVTGMDIQIYDAGLAVRTAENIETGDTNYGGGTDRTTTVWTVYNRDSTEVDVTDNPVATSSLCSSTPASPWNGSVAGQAVWSIPEQNSATGAQAPFKNNWASICRRTGGATAGRYLLRVQTTGNGSGANRYAIRVQASSTVKPRISGYGDMSMYNNVSAGNAEFFLAEVEPAHRGKTLELKLYDPGEVSRFSNGTGGNGTMEIIAPSGSVAPSCGASDTGGVLTGTLSPCRFATATGGTARFNGQWVTIRIAIPTTYSCTMGTIPGCWWKIRYIIDGQGNDTTTWSAQVVGDPVHLVEE